MGANRAGVELELGFSNLENCGAQQPADRYVCANDIDLSGGVDFDDIDCFVVCLINNGGD